MPQSSSNRTTLRHTTCLFLCLSFVVGILVPSAFSGIAYADPNVLYGVTYDPGKLLDLSLNVKGVTERANVVKPFPELIGFHSLLFSNGYFYAGFQAAPANSTNVGKLYRFGFFRGDEQIVGNTGYWAPLALAKNSSGQVYASCSQSASFGATSVGTIDLSTGAMNGSSLVVNSYPNAFQYLQGLAFKADGSLFAFGTHPNTPQSVYFATINTSTGGLTPSSLEWFLGGSDPSLFADMAIDPDTGDVIGAARTTIGNQGSTAFYRLTFTTSPYDVSYEYLGAVYNEVVTGLAFGPPQPSEFRNIPKFVGTPPGAGTPRGVGTRTQSVVVF